MVEVTLVCSDGDCAALYEAVGPPEELDAMSCDCGAWLQPLGLSAVAGEDAAAVVLLEPLS